LPPRPHFTTISPQSQGRPKGKPSCDDLPRLPSAGLPPFAQTQFPGFRRRPYRQPALALLWLRRALPFPPLSGFQQTFRALRHLRQSRSQAHRSRTCNRLFRSFQTPPRHACLPVHPLPPQVLFYSPPQQRSTGRPAPYRQLTPRHISHLLECGRLAAVFFKLNFCRTAFKRHLRSSSPRCLAQRQFLLRQVIIRAQASWQLRVEAVTQTT